MDTKSIEGAMAIPAQDDLELQDELLWGLFWQLPEDCKAEIVDGEIHVMTPGGARHGHATLVIAASLLQHEGKAPGRALPDNVTFRLRLGGRLRTFSPDAAWFTGPWPGGSETLQGAPAFAVEVRSVEDYGPAAERRMARKRTDYFDAGTLVVWDVDLLGPETVRVYRVDAPETPQVVRRGETADAEPAVAGWLFEVDQLFA